MSNPCLKIPCCENFCLKSGSNGPSSSELPLLFSNLNLYVKSVIQGPFSSPLSNLTFNSITNSYEPIWEWRGFVRTFQSNGNALPVRLIQSTPFHNGGIWFIQVRNWTIPQNAVAQQYDYLILAFNQMSGSNCFTDFPEGDFLFNDENNSQYYQPGDGITIQFNPNILSQLIAVDVRNEMSLSQGYCSFQS